MLMLVFWVIMYKTEEGLPKREGTICQRTEDEKIALCQPTPEQG